MVTQTDVYQEIRTALERALEESNPPEKDYHIRTALQHVESIEVGMRQIPDGSDLP
ncbi:MAG: hypothetical protein ABEJ27_00985 [Halodesulfurarchaeum sp.]